MEEMEKKNETITRMVRSGRHMTLAKSIQAADGLLELAGRLHKEKILLAAIPPDQICMQETEGEVKLFLRPEALKKTKMSDPDDLWSTASVMPGFRSREIAVKKRSEIGIPSDLYFITAFFYYCLTGRNRSRLQMFRSRIPDLDEVIHENPLCPDAERMLRRILKRGLEPEVKYRYQALREMKEDLKELGKCLEKKGES